MKIRSPTEKQIYCTLHNYKRVRQKMVRIIKTVSIVLILIQVIIGYSESAAVDRHNGLELTANDTIAFLNIPDRTEHAIEGSEFANQVAGLSLADRERAVAKEILSGNVPSFSRKLRPLTINQEINSKNYELTFFTVCDYMAIGSDQDYLYIPMTPSTAQYLADSLGCSLPTKKMVDIIYNKAEIKLHPQPIPPSDKMTTVPVFKQHTDSIKQQILQNGFDRSADNIIGGHKKDVIISKKIYSPDRNYERVVIYGWHLSENNPIQPVYNGHIAKYADYSHGICFISNIAFINGDSIRVAEILQDPNLADLLSSEGVISKPYYPESDIFTSMRSRSKNSRIDFMLNQNYPNPFNPTTVINYQLPIISLVDLSIFSLTGKKVITLVSEEQPAGIFKVEWNASNFASGLYFYRLETDQGFVRSRKLILLK